MIYVNIIERRKIISIRCPHKRKRLAVLMKCGIKRGQVVIIAKLTFPFGYSKLLLHIQGFGYKPQIGRKELQARIVQSGFHIGNVQLYRQRISCRRHLGKIIENLPSFPCLQIYGGELRFSSCGCFNIVHFSYCLFPCFQIRYFICSPFFYLSTWVKSPCLVQYQYRAL